MCIYSDDTGYKCPHESLEGSDYCIFHFQDDNKDVAKFNEGINKILNTEEDSIHFNGFYFPPKTAGFSKRILKNVSFFNAKFSGKADFWGTIFSETSDFRETKFLEESDFGRTLFSEVDFENAEFSEEVHFGDAEFSEAKFVGAKFSLAYFEYATFSEKVDFGGATFSEAFFGEATFSKAFFGGVTFSEEVNFYGAKFSEEVSFYGAKFSGIVNFIGAEFSEAHFTSSRFSGIIADFGETAFLDKAIFEDVIFSKTTVFENAKFSGKADFEGAEFPETADFGGAIFSGIMADFRETRFLGTAIFEDAMFSGKADFEETEFSEKADFKGAEFSGKFILIPSNSNNVILIYFNGTFFSDFVRIKTNLSQCTFINSNIERADLTGSTWLENNGYKIIIWEENQDMFSYDPKELEGIYRRLKQSYQKYGDSETAGKFYYQEMECKRKQMSFLKRNSWKVGLKWSCGYGEEPLRVIGASAIIIFLFAFFYLLGGIEYLGSELASKPAKLIAYDLNLSYSGFQMLIQNFYSIFNDFLFCVYTSVITFTTLGYGDVHPIGWSRLFASIEAGIGIFMTALFIFVFTRKMLR